MKKMVPCLGRYYVGVKDWLRREGLEMDIRAYCWENTVENYHASKKLLFTARPVVVFRDGLCGKSYYQRAITLS